MSISLPSKEIYVVDVPEATAFTCEFNYNFHVPDESISDLGSSSKKILQRRTDSIDESFKQHISTRAARYVMLAFKPPKLFDAQNRKQSNVQYGSLIADNLKKIVNEDHFSSDGFVGVNIHDAK